MKDPVVVTGIGLVTPVGIDAKSTWSALCAGETAIAPIKGFDASAYPSRIASEVGRVECDRVDKKTFRRLDAFVQFALKATFEALDDSALSFDKEKAARVGVVIGSGIGGLRVIEAQHSILLSGGPDRVSPFLIPMLIPDMAAGQIAITIGAKGPNFATVSACASGAHALAVSLDMLHAGRADAIIAGGTESCITPLGLAGFCSMKALSTRNDDPKKASRPFDQLRDGFIMGEGAGILILERLSHAKQRNAPHIYGLFKGYGMSCDAYHIAAPDPAGDGAYLCMKSALDSTKVSISEVDYINAHGTSTMLNDKSETVAIKRLFGARASNVAISSNKSMTGHLLGAAGAVEFAATMLTLRDRIIPPTINYEVPDPECDLDYVPNIARQAEVHTAISNSFGFGGHNICLVAQTYREE
ncbi:MAG: beta-ketoacyl-ACP synthase II [Candidatus Ratteibacteria bacterium]|jgi:3-oxoacyl-[acyl-carrier-protein] synthase II